MTASLMNSSRLRNRCNMYLTSYAFRVPQVAVRSDMRSATCCAFRYAFRKMCVLSSASCVLQMFSILNERRRKRI